MHSKTDISRLVLVVQGHNGLHETQIPILFFHSEGNKRDLVVQVGTNVVSQQWHIAFTVSPVFFGALSYGVS